jgi:hypothetical protein
MYNVQYIIYSKVCTTNNILYIIYSQTKAIKKIHIKKFEFRIK